jgi:hypothetical protein
MTSDQQKNSGRLPLRPPPLLNNIVFSQMHRRIHHREKPKTRASNRDNRTPPDRQSPETICVETLCSICYCSRRVERNT